MGLDATFNARHSNSEGLPELDRDSQQKLLKISAKEKEHYNFLNTLKKNLRVDQTKLIDLECRLSGNEKETISQHLALSDNCSHLRRSKIIYEKAAPTQNKGFPINQVSDQNLSSKAHKDKKYNIVEETGKHITTTMNLDIGNLNSNSLCSYISSSLQAANKQQQSLLFMASTAAPNFECSTSQSQTFEGQTLWMHILRHLGSCLSCRLMMMQSFKAGNLSEWKKSGLNSPSGVLFDNNNSRGLISEGVNNDDSQSRHSIGSNSELNPQMSNSSIQRKSRKSNKPQKIQARVVHATLCSTSPKLQNAILQKPHQHQQAPDISHLEPQNMKRFKSFQNDEHQPSISNTSNQLLVIKDDQLQQHLQSHPGGHHPHTIHKSFSSIHAAENMKLTEFFNSSSGPTGDQQAPQSGMPDLRIKEENDKLRKDLEQHERMIRQKDQEIEKSNQLLSTFSQQIKEIQSVFEHSEAQKKIFIESHIKTLTQLEEKLRKEKRIWLNEQAIRLGRLTTQRQGTKYLEIWEEGEAFKKLHSKLKEISQEKEEIERLKKNRNKQKIVKKNGAASLPAVPLDGFSGTTSGSSTRLLGGGSTSSGMMQMMNECSEFDLEESEFNNIDKNEQKEIYQFKQRLLENEEKRIREELSLLEKEKCKYLNEFKRMRDEEFSKYCGIHSKQKNAVMASKYLILSLLGKGGYSEVYKAYDLENCREVACKIHHFDDAWNETIKESYIKHALRENEIHKDLNNRRVVKQYDTVEIDHNSFCTVLELCSGPDLYFYLKQNKQVPEKEAKLIISQILSGLKYLNDQKQKIIHYDLKPQNILFHNGEVKITDFGLCKIMEENQEKIELTSQGVGTYWYQAPECFDMSHNPPMINSKVDIWSVGIIFFEILFGQKPFGNDKTQQAILQDQTILNAREVTFPQKPQISDGCKEFIRKCLAYYQHDRYDVYEAYYSPYLRGGSTNLGSLNQKGH